MTKFLRIPWRWWRRAAQLALLLMFLWLFRRTESTGAERLAGGENLFFRLDPLAAAAAMLAARRLIATFWPAAAIVLLTMLWGRFFCGWVCPLGTLLDYFHRLCVAGPLSLWRRLKRRLKGRLKGGWSRKLKAAEGDCPPSYLSRRAGSPSYLSPGAESRGYPALRAVRYVLLFAVLVSAVFAFPLVGLVDPFSLLVRGMTFAVHPLLVRGSKALVAWYGGHWEKAVMQFQLAWVSAAILAVIFGLELVARRFWCRFVCPAGAMLGLLGRRALLERVPAKACRCCAGQRCAGKGDRPLSREDREGEPGEEGCVATAGQRLPAPLATLPLAAATDCAIRCRMGAFNSGGQLLPESCNLCMDCVDFCPRSMVRFRWRKGGEGRVKSGGSRISGPRHASLSNLRSRPVDLSRRAALAGIALGAAAPAAAAAARLLRAEKGTGASTAFPHGLEAHPTSAQTVGRSGDGRPSAGPPRYLLRPPGAGDEQTFLSLCIRCGECMKVCPNNALQPTVFEAGIEGLFSPRLMPRFIFELSSCEYRCTLCGQVCPSGAIPRLDEQAKHQRPTGKAYFDHTRCLPWAEKKECLCCQEMCPAPNKAIKLLDPQPGVGDDGEAIEIQRPYVDRDLCVGCGLCESKCPLPFPGPAAIRVQRPEAPDPGTESLLDKSKLPPGAGKGP